MNPRQDRTPGTGDAGGSRDQVGTGSVSSLPPGSDIAERYFVGALLHQRAETVAVAAGVVMPEWIHDPQVRGVYAALLENISIGLQPDPAGIVPTMMRLGLPAHRAPLASALVVDLLAEVPLPSNWRYYAVIVANGHVRNRLHEIGLALADRAHVHPLERLQLLLQEANDEINAVNGNVAALAGGAK